MLSRTHLLTMTALWWLVFLVLSFTHDNHFHALNILGFLFLSIVPGMLTVLALRLEIPFFASLSLSVAFSLLELMLVGLTGNFLLPKLGIIAPLSQNVLLLEISILVFALSWVAWKLNFRAGFSDLLPSRIDVWFLFLSSLFVLQSIVGALTLNNGGGGLWTFTLLGEIAVFCLALYVYAEKVGENTIPVALFFIASSLLLMTSLRGWYITGHDVQTEYRVFELTKNAGIWNMDFYRDAYNACLSITILPTIFFNLLKVSDQYIYKFFFQFFFALCPGVAYLISRHWTGKRTAFLAGFYFVAFPTFFSDMPFLVRQEIAFLFYGLMLYVIFEQSLSIKIRRRLFLVMGIGVILSHYSTTYTVLLIFTLAVITKPVFVRLMRFFEEKRGPDGSVSLENKTTITFTVVAVLFLATFLWTSAITNTGGHLREVMIKTLYAARDGLTENNRSTDAMNLLSFRKPSQQDELKSYIEKVVAPIREKATSGTYFNESTYEKYSFTALPDEHMPLTEFGSFFQKTGIDFVSLISLFGRILAKLMEVIVPVGMLYVLLKKSSVKKLDSEFYLIASYCLVFIFLIIVIPVLSTEYGILRAMQQSMFVLALPMIFGSFWIWNGVLKAKLWLGNSYRKTRGLPAQSFSVNRKSAFPIIFPLIFFLYSASFIPQIFGGGTAALHLNNSGRYYDNYLIKPREIAAGEWLLSVGEKGNINGMRLKIQTGKNPESEFYSLSSLGANNDIFPGVVRKDAYVYLGQATVQKQRTTFTYEGDQITYTYPVSFLDENKNLIYNNGSARIYR